jgi:DNA polymerase-4
MSAIRSRGAASAPSHPDSSRRILLVDCDAFFVQVARLEDPEGAGREPLLIVGGRPGERGVVCSASYEARRYGVRSAMPMARALRLCPGAMLVPVPRGACGRKSAEVRAVLERLASVVEQASIDEFYLDLTGTEAVYGGEELAETAERIRRAVLEETEIAVSVGGGTQRMIAKLAVGLAKPAGVHIVPAGTESAFMERFELADLPSVGPVLAERLRGYGLRTVPDALRYDEATLCAWLGEGTGRALYRRVRGLDSTPVAARATAKSISREETFPSDLHTDAELEAELLRLVVRAAADLRREGLRARTVTVRIRDADFRTRQAGRTLPEGVESDRAIHAVALELLVRLRAARRTGARLLGVSLSQLGAAGAGAQLGLFEASTTSPGTTPGSRPAEGGQIEGGDIESERDRRLAHAVDRLRDRFGPGAVVPGRIVGR